MNILLSKSKKVKLWKTAEKQQQHDKCNVSGLHSLLIVICTEQYAILDAHKVYTFLHRGYAIVFCRISSMI